MNLGFTKYEADFKEYNGVSPSIVFLCASTFHYTNNVINSIKFYK